MARVLGRKAAHRDGGRGGPGRLGAHSRLEGGGSGWGLVGARRGTGAAPLAVRAPPAAAGDLPREATRGGEERPCRRPAAASERGKERGGRCGRREGPGFMLLRASPPRGAAAAGPGRCLPSEESAAVGKAEEPVGARCQHSVFSATERCNKRGLYGHPI